MRLCLRNRREAALQDSLRFSLSSPGAPQRAALAHNQLQRFSYPFLTILADLRPKIVHVYQALLPNLQVQYRSKLEINHEDESHPVVAICSLLVLGDAASAAAKENHHDGERLLGDKLETDGHHDIDHKGKYTTSVEVKQGKIAEVHVKHSENGEIPGSESVVSFQNRERVALAHSNQQCAT